MEQKGLRGSALARIDDKGRLKIPTIYRGAIQDQRGSDVFVTSLSGDSVLIYPMPVWLGIERKLMEVASSIPSRRKFLDRVNYFGQESEIDGQGRVVIPAQLRERASIVGDVQVFGRIDYLEVWNHDLFVEKLRREDWSDEDALRLAEYGI